MRARVILWPAVVAVLVLVARWLAYALAPSPLARVLEHSAGGPSLIVVTLVSAGLAVLVSVAVVWLAALGVRERSRLAQERVAPALRLRRLGLRAVGLYVTSSLAFTLFESYLHWRAGIGFHGLSCLVGPVHRNAIPLLAALALAAAALAEAGEHVLAPGHGRAGGGGGARARLGPRGRPRAAPPPARAAGLRLLRSTFDACPVAARGAGPFARAAAPRGLSPDHANGRRPMRFALAAAGAAALTLVLASAASTHAIMSPPIAKAKVLQQFPLSVPTEQEGATTTEIELPVPDGFAIDSFEPSPGWKRTEAATGSGEERSIQKITWSGGKVPTDEDAVFRFNGSMASNKTYTFEVRQTYSSGKLVDWNGPEDPDPPAPTIEAVSDLGGSSSSTLTIVALVVGAIGVVLGIIGLATRGRPLT